LPPLPPTRASHAISPELVLVDRGLAELHPGEHAIRQGQPEPSVPVVTPDAREAIRRMCELSDVNPPRIRHRRAVAFSGVLTLWAEALSLLAAQLPHVV
jgi:hypothetical protein